MVRLLSSQVFHEPPAPSMIASVLKLKVGQNQEILQETAQRTIKRGCL
jgi:hypothetical protein